MNATQALTLAHALLADERGHADAAHHVISALIKMYGEIRAVDIRDEHDDPVGVLLGLANGVGFIVRWRLDDAYSVTALAPFAELKASVLCPDEEGIKTRRTRLDVERRAPGPENSNGAGWPTPRRHPVPAAAWLTSPV